MVAAAAVIFLPDILDGKKQSYQPKFEQIPQQTRFKQASEVKEFPEQTVIDLQSPTLSDEQPQDADFEQAAIVNQGLQKSSDAGATAEKVIEVAALPARKRLDDNPDDKEAQVHKETKPAWVIQLGSFKHQANVDNLMKKLKAQGYLAYTRPIATSQGELIKVFVGPELDKNKLIEQQSALQKLTGSRGKLVQYRPAKN